MSALSIRLLAGAALVLVLAAGGTLLGWLAWPARPIAVGHVPTTPADAATIVPVEGAWPAAAQAIIDGSGCGS